MGLWSRNYINLGSIREHHFEGCLVIECSFSFLRARFQVTFRTDFLCQNRDVGGRFRKKRIATTNFSQELNSGDLKLKLLFCLGVLGNTFHGFCAMGACLKFHGFS